MVTQVPIAHADLLSHPHLLLHHAPDFTVVPQGLVCLDRLIVVPKFDHNVPFGLQDAVEDKFVLEEGVSVVRELSHEVLKHFLDRLQHLVYDDFFYSFKLPVDEVNVLDGALALLLISVHLHWVVDVLRHEILLVEVIRLQHKVHHALVLVLDRVNHPVKLLFSLVYRRGNRLNPINGPPDDPLVLVLLVVAYQLGHHVEIFLAVFLDQLGDPRIDSLSKLADFLLKAKLLLYLLV